MVRTLLAEIDKRRGNFFFFATNMPPLRGLKTKSIILNAVGMAYWQTTA
jgi:hypothetical protein